MASQTPTTLSLVDRSFIIDRQGKPAVLYAGLLDLAHRSGLKSITVTLLQAPSDANGNTAISHARSEFEDGRIFEDIGDANASNVGRMVAAHIIRMSATRAKARTLRDALNISGAAVEEFGDDEDAPSQRQAPSAPRPLRVVDEATGEVFDPPTAATPSPRAPQDLRPSDAATREDLTKLKSLLRQLGKTDQIGADLTHGGAVLWISALVDEFNAKAGAR